MFGRSGAEEALTRLLGGRPHTVQEASTVLGVDIETANDLIGELVADGHLQQIEETIAYPSPAIRSGRRIREHLAAIDASLRHIAQEARALPGRVDEWAVEDGVRWSPILRLRDFDELDVFTRRWHGGRLHDRIMAMAPDADTLTIMAARFAPIRGHLEGVRIDLAVAPGAVASAESRRRVDELVGTGIDCRLHPDVDRLLFVATGATVLRAVPDDDLMLVQNATIADLARSYFDVLWTRGTPLGLPDTDALMDALATGQTVEAAARSLGVSTRTAQRRLAHLMSVHGATSLFTLGAAWQRQVASG